jgi:hypothetical protein
MMPQARKFKLQTFSDYALRNLHGHYQAFAALRYRLAEQAPQPPIAAQGSPTRAACPLQHSTLNNTAVGKGLKWGRIEHG